MDKGWASIAAAMGAALVGMAVAASVSAQGYGTTRDSRIGANASSETSPCDKLSGRTRESCIDQIRRDDAQRGVNSRSASNANEIRPGGAAGTGASGTFGRNTGPGGSSR